MTCLPIDYYFSEQAPWIKLNVLVYYKAYVIIISSTYSSFALYYSWYCCYGAKQQSYTHCYKCIYSIISEQFGKNARFGYIFNVGTLRTWYDTQVGYLSTTRYNACIWVHVRYGYIKDCISHSIWVHARYGTLHIWYHTQFGYLYTTRHNARFYTALNLGTCSILVH
jgi:hypothetical protein